MTALIERPDQLGAMRDDRSLMPSAVEEILRWTSATLYNRRTATRPTELGGHTIDEGAKVTLWWPSANRDETVFDDPFRFDIRRTPNAHLTFGHRTHFCLGANLARLEIRMMFEEILHRLEEFELTGPVERVRTNKPAGVCRGADAFPPPGGMTRLVAAGFALALRRGRTGPPLPTAGRILRARSTPTGWPTMTDGAGPDRPCEGTDRQAQSEGAP
jgi:hypothetical protein